LKHESDGYRPARAVASAHPLPRRHGLVRYPAGPAALVPTLWIVLGPLGQSITAANLLGGVAKAIRRLLPCKRRIATSRKAPADGAGQPLSGRLPMTTGQVSEKVAVSVVFVAAMFMSIMDSTVPGFNV
jgi:hypothetical protein